MPSGPGSENAAMIPRDLLPSRARRAPRKGALLLLRMAVSRQKLINPDTVHFVLTELRLLDSWQTSEVLAEFEETACLRARLGKVTLKGKHLPSRDRQGAVAFTQHVTSRSFMTETN